MDVSDRLKPGFTIVGLPGKSTRESRDRIQSAICNSGFRFPNRDRTTVNLAPAFQKKDGGVFDLPMALGILLATGQVRLPDVEPGVALPVGCLGELGLQGELRPVPGALLIASALRDHGVPRVIVPAANATEVSLTPGIQVFSACDLHEALLALQGRLEAFEPPSIGTRGPTTSPGASADPDFADVRGQEVTKRGILVAAAGGHNLLLIGPPGVGKTMLARRIPGILPILAFEEAIEVLRVYSSVGLLHEGSRQVERPFRAPHHTISYAGLVGGGNPPRAGEITLAHRGVLFLDELPEFSRRVLETLRQPMETGSITISRSSGSIDFPASFLVVAAMNPCPCGHAGQPGGGCRCSPRAIDAYRGRISGPLLDRIDLVLEVPPPGAGDILGGGGRGPPGLSTLDLRARVDRARELQRGRWGPTLLNAQVSQDRLLSAGSFTAPARRCVLDETRRLRLSARGIARVLRVARTLADLASDLDVEPRHVLEALAFRRPVTLEAL